MATRSYSGNAKSTVLADAVNTTATTFLVADGTGYPDGTAGPFIVTLSGGSASEEKVLCSARTGTSFTVATGGRGFDDTTASTHSNQALVQHTFSATDAREANAHVNATTGAHAATAIAFTPGGALASTNMQAALAELDAEKLSTADATATYLAKAALTSAIVETLETTTSTAYTDLATVGPSVTVPVAASGRVLVTIGSLLSNDTAGVASFMTVALSGANVIAAADTVSRLLNFRSASAGQGIRASRQFVISGLAAGSTTFTAKYRAASGTSSFDGRALIVIPL